VVEFSQDQVSQNFNLNSFKQKVILFIKAQKALVNLSRLSEQCQVSDTADMFKVFQKPNLIYCFIAWISIHPAEVGASVSPRKATHLPGNE
jgi:hypothetical protein